MRRAASIFTAAAILLLAGCSSSPVVETPTTPEAADGCLTLSDAAVESLQSGLDEKGAGYTLTATAAIEHDDAWWVAAHATGDPDVTAVWMTIHDPTVNVENAFLSATELASLISVYKMPSDLTGADPVEAAEDCLP